MQLPDTAFKGMFNDELILSPCSVDSQFPGTDDFLSVTQALGKTRFFSVFKTLSGQRVKCQILVVAFEPNTI